MSDGSLSKYWKQRKDRQGNPIHWPGNIDGIPLRGDIPPSIKQEEYERLPTVFDAQSAIFELPSELEKYNEVMDRCANGWYQLRFDQFLSWDQSTKTLFRFVAWIERHSEDPKNAKLPQTGKTIRT